MYPKQRHLSYLGQVGLSGEDTLEFTREKRTKEAFDALVVADLTAFGPTCAHIFMESTNW